MAMVGFIAVGQHTGALGRQRIEWFRFGRHFALAGGQAPVEAAEGDTGCPGEQRIQGGSLFCLAFVVVVFSNIFCYKGISLSRPTIFLREVVKVECDIVYLGLNFGQFDMNNIRIIVTHSITQSFWHQKCMRGLGYSIEHSFE
ncbi:hypothetical protein [Halomonas alimentaria]|uniref:hypothetical protein n=1 Tax=Halomonas alimentaria TaxID=147248 RepID=UPI00197AF48F|nr:hypothetical protein [Halomonas alimentaria]